MAAIAIAGIGAYAGSAASAAGASGITLALITAATAAAAIGASYIDQRYIYPQLFGSDKPRQDVLSGVDVMTGDDGSPGHTSWGRFAMVGGHVLWFENVETTSSTTSTKKGGGVPIPRKIADFGVGWTRNLIARVEQVFADQKVLWRRDPNNVVWVEWRLNVSLTTVTVANDAVRLAPQIGGTVELPQIFAAGDVVLMSGNLTLAQNGWWRVRRVNTDAALPFGHVDLTPLAGQTPAVGTPGTAFAPLEIRRQDGAIVDFTNQILPVSTNDKLTMNFVPIPVSGVAAVTDQDSHFWRAPNEVMVPGSLVRLENFSNAVNGLWKVWTGAKIPGVGYEWVSTILIVPWEGQPVISPTHTSATNPGRILLATDEGFLEPVPGQEMQVYLGTEDQGPDVDLSAIYGAAFTHGYRGLARSTFRNFNLSNWGDRVPSLSASISSNVHHTTHDVIAHLMRECFRGDDARYDLSGLEPDILLGYTRRGVQQSSTTLQPVMMAYGIEAQERGDKWAFFKGADADLHVLREQDLGAHVGRVAVAPEAFKHQRIQDRYLPRRLSIYYRDPTNDFARTQKLARVSRPEDAPDETVAVDVDPLVLYPWDAQNALNRILLNAMVGRDQGTIAVPPSRCDILPNDRVTYTALNWNDEELVIVGGAIDHETQINGIEPFSVSIEVVFETLGTCRLVDDGNGELVGFPVAFTPSTNVVDYDAGTIEFAGDDDLLMGRLRYEFENDWRMRVQRIQRQRRGVTVCDVMSVAEQFAVSGSPVQINDPGFALVARVANIVAHIIDLPVPWRMDVPGVYFAAAPQEGSAWRGAGVYASHDGIAYTLRSVIQDSTGMGVTQATLGAGTLDVVDWINEVSVKVEHFGGIGPFGSDTLESVSQGAGFNWILVGDEILAFLEAEQITADEYVLRGLIRGLRDTSAAVSTHTTNERVVMLTALGIDPIATGNILGNGAFFQFDLPGDIGQNLYVKIVPTGGALDDYAATQIAWKAENVRPFTPTGLVQGDILTYGYAWDTIGTTYSAAAWLTTDVVIRWFRRTRALAPVFGAGSTEPLLEAIERYEVRVYRNGVELPARRKIVGGINSGSPFAHRTFRYLLAEQTADGFVSGNTAKFEVRQIGLGGQFGYSPFAAITWTVP